MIPRPRVDLLVHLRLFDDACRFLLTEAGDRILSRKEPTQRAGTPAASQDADHDIETAGALANVTRRCVGDARRLQR